MGNKILLSHGSGGKRSHDLISKMFRSAFDNPLLARMDDSAVLDLNGRIAFTTDSYVVTPIFFPGGDIGKLSICGTVNDLAMLGASPMYLSIAFVIEEGLPEEDLQKIVESIRKTSLEAGVQIVTGDTKVVEKGMADKIFINTSGLGMISEDIDISGSNAKAGDKIILSGTIGDHAVAILSQRKGLSFSTDLKSDCAPLNRLVSRMLETSVNIHSMRDPTRGGLATTLNEIASQSRIGINIQERDIPVRDEVRAACEMLGFDPLYLANEGKLIAIIAPEDAGKVLSAMRSHELGKNAAIIGEVTDQKPGRVVMTTAIGSNRIVDMLVGDMLPRIC